MKICILYGGTSTEREVSLNTGKSIYDAIYDVYDIVMHDWNGDYQLMYDVVRGVDLVFIALHGGDGEDGTVQKYLESKRIKFTGSSFDSVVIKPNNGGSSIGVSILALFNPILEKVIADAIVQNESIIIESFIDGRELTVSILDDKVLPIVEIIPRGNYYDYKCKYTKFQSDYVVPAEIDKKIQKLLSAYSLKIHKLIGCGVYSRSDFRLSKDGKIYFLEINTLPGFTDTSLFPKSAKAAGLKYKDLIKKIIENT